MLPSVLVSSWSAVVGVRGWPSMTATDKMGPPLLNCGKMPRLLPSNNGKNIITNAAEGSRRHGDHCFY